jgi:hypothetical protein
VGFVVRHVADRMPDRGKRGKDTAILQMGQDALKSFGNPELRYVGNDQAVLHTQVQWGHEAKSPTRHSI